MLKNIVKIEHKIGEKSYQLICDNDSPIAHVKEALFEFLKYVGKVEDNVKSQQESEVKEVCDEERQEESCEGCQVSA